MAGSEFYDKGKQDALAERPPVLPSDTKASGGDIAVEAVLTAICPVFGVFLASDLHDNSKKTPEADREYSLGYRDGITTPLLQKSNEDAYRRLVEKK